MDKKLEKLVIWSTAIMWNSKTDETEEEGKREWQDQKLEKERLKTKGDNKKGHGETYWGEK